MKKFSADYYLYFLLIFLSVFNDSFFSRLFGYFGRPILSVLFPAIFSLAVILGRKITVDRLGRTLFMLLCYLLAVNFVADIIYAAFFSKTIIGDDYTAVKSIKEMTFFLYSILYYALVLTFMKRLTPKQICKPFVFTFYFLLFVLIVEILTMPTAWPIFHYNNGGLIDSLIDPSRYYERVRLTTTESSLTVPLIITFGTVTLWHYKQEQNKLMLIVSAMAMLCFFITSSARTLLLFAIITILTLIMSFLCKKKTKKGIIIAVLILILLPLVGLLVVGIVYSEVLTKSLGSLTTRTMELIATVIHTVKYPLGVGNAIWGFTLEDILKNTVAWFSSNGPRIAWNYWEINQIIANGPEGLGGSFGILLYGLYWGVVGTVVFYVALIKLYKRYRTSRSYNMLLGAVFWGYIGIMTLTVPMNNCFPFWAFLAYLSAISSEREGRSVHC
ncbi:hypothetical protein [uncultured Dysosmobacter sp.]|uniref:hypothetical protein n=1 Tax=uncultured Dysosmobacter sp. TaxID=2591384 RepID=UPI00260CC33B|nr:hypothetical protein [uncultured Dysosmobacter sp.]